MVTRIGSFALAGVLAIGLAAPSPAMAQNVNGEQNINSSRGLLDDESYSVLMNQLILSALPIAAPVLLSSFYLDGINPRY
ncbi:hypothetical protein ACG98H_04990 [Corynebacterium sp. L4756]|uniref:hypothetical protein n=1 Tax=unclassified Corynebacterium TaxID=2624378 RepID=UPI00374CEE75